jgi:hypothetical protein
MHVHLRVRRWVLWWAYVGLVGGAIAVVNILGHNLTGTQDRILLLIGTAHWILGGIVCWAFDGVQIESRPPLTPPIVRTKDTTSLTEYHPASDFLLPGGRRSLLPWRH